MRQPVHIELTARVRAVERRDEWNALVREFSGCDARHAWEWGELRAQQGWSPLRLAAFAGGECVAAAAVLLRRVPGLGTVAYAPRGPLLDPTRVDAWDAAAALADATRVRTSALVVRTSPPVLVEDAVSWTPLEARGFRRQPDLWSLWNTPRNVMRLDLIGEERDLLARMAKKRRQHIATAGKKGVSADVVRGLAPIYRFKAELGAKFRLYAGYYDRVYAPVAYHVGRWLERWTLRNARWIAIRTQNVLRAMPRWCIGEEPVEYFATCP